MATAKLLFAGTPAFALESLWALVEAGHVPLAVLTQPDRRAGRGRKLTPGPVKRFATDHGIPVWQPETLRDPDTVARIGALEADLAVVAAYGLLLPNAVLALPKRGCVNVHASLLPRWRGAAPVQAAIRAGDTTTGISLMQMDAGLDTGPVLATAATDIAAHETAGILEGRLAILGGQVLVQNIDAILDGRLEAVPQDENLATVARKFRKEDAAIDWSDSADQIARNIRAYDPAPGASFGLGGERIKCWKADALAGDGGPPGKILAAGRDGIDVACGAGVLRLAEVQRPGRRRITAAQFAGQATLAGGRLD